jgi:CubicO group peptidase (beta-lactamase class C family)
MAKKLQLSLTFLLLSATLKGQVPQQFQLRWDSLITAYHHRLAKVNIAGSSIAFIQNGEILAKDWYGYQDKDTKDPITLQTIYNWGSCTKLFTAIAVMQLRDQGQLKLEEPIAKFIPEVKNFKNNYTNDITIAQLLTHTSGLPRFSRSTKLKDGIFYEVDNWDTFQKAFSETELLFDPGSKYSYSNLGYDLLGRLIERITHISFPQYVTFSTS